MFPDRYSLGYAKLVQGFHIWKGCSSTPYDSTVGSHTKYCTAVTSKC